MKKRDRGLPAGLALSGGSHFATGRADRIITFPASTPIEHDRDPVTDLEFDPDTLPSAHIVLPDTTMATPPDRYVDALTASILDRIGVELAGLSANLRKLAATIRPGDGAA